MARKIPEDRAIVSFNTTKGVAEYLKTVVEDEFGRYHTRQTDIVAHRGKEHDIYRVRRSRR